MENVADKYPVGTRVMGEVVNVMSYGAFVKLEEGIEGLVHISRDELDQADQPPQRARPDWRQDRGRDPRYQQGEAGNLLGDEADADQPLGSGGRQVSAWHHDRRTVRNLTNYGAFIEIEEGIDGLLHISDMSWTRKIGHPNELLEKGQRISCQVLNVDQERKRIALGLKQLRRRPVGDRHPQPLRGATMW